MNRKSIFFIGIILLSLFVPNYSSAQITDINQMQEGTNYMLFSAGFCKEGGAFTVNFGRYQSVLGYGCDNNVEFDIRNSLWTCEKEDASQIFYFKNEEGGYIKNGGELTWDKALACKFNIDDFNGKLTFSGTNSIGESVSSIKVYRASDCIAEIDGLKYIMYPDVKEATIIKKTQKCQSGKLIIPSEIKCNNDVYSVTCIKKGSFRNSQDIESVTGKSVKTIGHNSFQDCKMLQSIDFPAVIEIDPRAFGGCVNLKNIDLISVETLWDAAFYDCNIKTVSLPNTLRSYVANCFNKARILIFNGKTPPQIWGTNDLPSSTMIKVPEEFVDAYKKAEGWKNYAGQILSLNDVTDYDVTTCAQSNSSGLYNAIGGNNLDKVISLKVRGTINGYDIMLMRNKMPHLNDIDISETTVLANNYEYYTGYHTEDNVIGGYSFYNWSKLASLKLPKSVTEIGVYAVGECHNLSDVILPNSLITIKSRAFYHDENLNNIEFPTGLKTIGSDAFSDCKNLSVAELPANLETIASGVFSGCEKLTRIELPPSLKTISTACFAGCSSLDSISLPGIETIGASSFAYCYQLSSIKMPSTLKSIGDNAFALDTLNRVYVYTIEPVDIGQNTFSSPTYKNAILYIPKQAWNNYYYNTQWSQFSKLEEFDEPYKYFYLNKEFTLEDRFTGEPDIDINPGGGIIVPDKPEQGDQDADTIHIKGDGKNWASIIANANLNAKGLYIDITIKANRWYFFSFPFKVRKADISCGKNVKFVFRTYNGAIRADKGTGGWIDLDSSEEYLYPGKGYIFQASLDCTLSIKIEKNKFGKLPKVDVDTKLDIHTSTNEQNASWNFVGNPFTAFYDINDMGYTSPITRWNSDSKTYEAVRPGDDNAFLNPFEAFFVQCPKDNDDINFGGDKRLTQTGRDKKMNSQMQKARMEGQFDVQRQIVNLTLSDGTTTDKTRVVFNPDKKAGYERDCDAAKFESNGASELYSVEALAGRLAINERPEGSVKIGYRAAKAGEYTIAAQRMDRQVLLRDNDLQITFDLTQGDYHFTSDAGEYDNRFMLLIDNSTTGIGDIVTTTGVNVKPTDSGLNISNLQGKTLHVYALDGALYATRTQDGFLGLAKGVYLVEVEGLKAKFMVR